MRPARCPGCGVEETAIDGATHPYVGASSACWTQFGEIDFALPLVPIARLVIDAYMVQHPGVPERRSIRSVCLHLTGLCLVLEHGLPAGKLSTTLQRILASPPEWRWLEPPSPNGELTISDVAEALGTDDAPDVCERYVRASGRPGPSTTTRSRAGPGDTTRAQSERSGGSPAGGRSPSMT